MANQFDSEAFIAVLLFLPKLRRCAYFGSGKPPSFCSRHPPEFQKSGKLRRDKVVPFSDPALPASWYRETGFCVALYHRRGGNWMIALRRVP